MTEYYPGKSEEDIENLRVEHEVVWRMTAEENLKRLETLKPKDIIREIAIIETALLVLLRRRNV